MAKLTPRDYQPALIWALASEYAREHLPGRDGSEPREHDIHLYVYRTDQAGAYYLYGPKLYWQDEPGTGDHWGNIDQGDMAEHADALGEVTITNRRTRKTVLLGQDYETALIRLRGNRPGPVPMGHDRTLPAIGVTSELAEAMEALADKLKITTPELRRRAYEAIVKQ